jgi:hypothetical protein
MKLPRLSLTEERKDLQFMKVINTDKKMNKVSRFALGVAACVGSYLAAMVFANDSMMGSLREMSEWGIEGSTLFLLFLLCAYFIWNKNLSISGWLIALSGLLSLCMLIGRSFVESNSLNGILGSPGQSLTAFLFFLGYFTFFFLGLTVGGHFAAKWGKTRRVGMNRIEVFLFEKHPFLLTLGLILISSLPYFLAFFPGTLQPDARGQLNFYYGISPLTNQHPIFSTLYLGFLFDMGKHLFGSDNGGIMLYSMVQTLIQALVFAYSFLVLKRLKAPMGLRYATLAYYALFPQWAIWGITFIKDTMHYVMVLLYVEALIEILLDWEEGKINRKHIFFFCFSGVMASLIRHNGIFMVGFTTIAAIFIYRRLWRVWAAGLIAMVAAVFFVNVVVGDLLGAEKWPARESLSIPFQQTSRYVREYMDELTEDEILAITAILPYEVIATTDSPELSDPIKNVMYPDVTSREMKTYWKTWAEQGGKHPGVYVQAFLNQCYGYFYPDKKEYKDGLGWWYLGDIYLEIGFREGSQGARDFFISLAEWVRGLPVIGMLYSTGAHTYLLLICITALLVQHRKRELLLFIPSMVTLLICLVSPVNALIRYMLPIMVVLPLSVAWCYKKTS